MIDLDNLRASEPEGLARLGRYLGVEAPSPAELASRVLEKLEESRAELPLFLPSQCPVWR